MRVYTSVVIPLSLKLFHNIINIKLEFPNQYHIFMAHFMALHLFSFMQGIFTVATSSVVIISAAATLNQVKVLAYFQLLLLLFLLRSCSACRMRCSMQMSPDMQISVSLAGDVVVVVVVMCAYDLAEPLGGARPARQADWQREASVWVVPKRLACFISLTQPAGKQKLLLLLLLWRCCV